MISFSAHCGTNAVPPSERAVAARRSSMAARAGERVADQAERLRAAPPPSGTRAVRPSPRGPGSRAPRRRARRAGTSRLRRPSRSARARRPSIASRAPDDLDAVVRQGGAERRRRVDGGARPSCTMNPTTLIRTGPLLRATAASRSTGASSTPRRPWSRNSTLPAGPRSGEATTPSTPTAVRPERVHHLARGPVARRRGRERRPRSPRPPVPPRTAASPGRRTRRRDPRRSRARAAPLAAR